jgi:peptide maturation system protein (TIGR04066 family)
MKTKVALYPYCSELLPVVKHFEKLQSNYKLEKLVSPPGLGLAGKDAAYVRNHQNIGIVVDDCLGLDDSSWDKLLITRCLDTTINNYEEHIVDIAESVLRLGKTISYYDKHSLDIPVEIQKLADTYPNQISFHTGDMRPLLSNNRDTTYSDIDKPVVLVGGLVSEADTFEVLLNLSAHLRTKGLHPAVFTSRPIGELFGFHSMGHIFNDKSCMEADKIMRLNKIVNDVVLAEVPDIIIMEAPDAVMRFNKISPNGFGIQTYMLCQAIAPDSFICCVPCDLGYGPLIDAISENFANNLSTPITAVHISNLIVDSAEMIQTSEMSYVHTDFKTVRNQLAKENVNANIPMYNVIEDGIEDLYNFLESNILVER